MNILRKITGFLLLVYSMLLVGCGNETIGFVSGEISETEQTEDAVAEAFIENAGTNQESLPEGEASEICVFVCGAVECEGVYTLAADSRVADALTAAGGFTSEADTDAVNLAETVQDGQKIYFPFEGEAFEASEDQGIVSVGTENADGKVNLNTATKEQLTSLPGIGDVKAENIIQYREQNGCFQNIQDIMNVNGIGDSIYQQIQELITVG